MSTPIDISITKKLSDVDFTPKTLDELKNDSTNVNKTYIPAIVADIANYKVPVTEFGKGGSVDGNSQPIMIRDVYVPNTEEDSTLEDEVEPVIDFDPLGGTVSTKAKLALYPDENNEFLYIAYNEETGKRKWGQEWDFNKTGSTVQYIDFNGKNKLVWYSWDKYCFEITNNGNTERIIQNNGKKRLHLSGDLLEENVVYEVEINVCSFSSRDSFMVHKGTMNFQLYFYEDVRASELKTIPLKVWGDELFVGYPFTTCIIEPMFNLFVQGTDDSNYRPLYSGTSLSDGRSAFPILAKAKAYFVKIKNTEVERGYDIYVMSY